MWTISNLVVVAIVAAIVYKVMPKLTLRNFFRACWKLIIHPFKRKEKELKKEWDEAKYYQTNNAKPHKEAKWQNQP